MTGRMDESPVALVLVAAGGLAREAAATARAAGVRVIGCLDDDAALWGREVAPGLSVLGGLDKASEHERAGLLVCAGRGAVRERLVRRLSSMGVGSDRYATLVHPTASLAPDTVVGPGTVVLAGVVATAAVVIEEHVVCMPNVVLTHDNHLEPYATICAGVVLGGNVRIGRAAYVGMAASVREGTSVGASALVGMGSVVLRDVPGTETWAGVPARRLARQPGGADERRPGGAAAEGTGLTGREATGRRR